MVFNIGAHVSISGGPRKAVEKQAALGGNCGQIFAGSPRTWKVSSYDSQDNEEFEDAREENNQGIYVIHSTYLVNLATPKDDLFEKSLNCLQSEIDAARDLGIEYVVFHPGAHTGSGVDNGIERIGSGIDKLDIHDDVTLLLENTAGKGTTIGKSMEQLNRILENCETNKNVGVCIDTCHAHAAGYDLENDIDSLVTEIKNTFGLELLDVLHLNDSKDELGSEKDNHDHIGEGNIGDEGFRNVVNHEDLRDLPMVLETPVDDHKGYAENVEKLKALRN